MTEPRLPRDRYAMLGLLGTGGMASVWRVLDVRLNVERAVKLLPHGVLREAQLAASLAHPHVVTVHDVLDVPEGTCVVMELAQGSVADVVAEQGPLPARTAARLLAEVCDALAVAHARGIVHRDVKPQNLLVMADGRVKLADFGVAALLDADAPAESTRAILGSLPYMAPEQRRGRAGPASDVYAVAVTLAWMVTGDLPGDLYVEEVREGLRTRLGADAGPLLALLERAGEHSPDARSGADALRDGLRAYAGEATGDALVPVARRGGGGATVGRWLWVGGAAGAARHPLWRWVAPLAALGAMVGYVVVSEQRPRTVAGRLPESLPVCDDAPESYAEQVRVGDRETLVGVLLDVDRDGALDAVFVNQGDETVTVYPSVGMRGLDAPVSRRLGRFASRPAQMADGSLWFADVDHAELVHVDYDRGLSDVVVRERAVQTSEPRHLISYDWDEDGARDLLFETRDCAVYRQTSTDGLTEHRCIAHPSDFSWLGQVFNAGPGSVPRPLVLLPEAVATVRGDRRGMFAELTRLIGLPFAAVSPHNVFVSDVDHDGADEIYLFSADAGVLRGNVVTDTWCRMERTAGLYDSNYIPTAVGDVDNDGVIDVLARATCRGCTSNHVLLRGRRVVRQDIPQ